MREAAIDTIAIWSFLMAFSSGIGIIAVGLAWLGDDGFPHAREWLIGLFLLAMASTFVAAWAGPASGL